MIRGPICKERIKETAAAVLIILSFWNVLYPEFSLTEDSYRKVEEGSAGEEGPRADYYEILGAERGEVEIRFSFLEDRKGKRVRAVERRPEGQEAGLES